MNRKFRIWKNFKLELFSFLAGILLSSVVSIIAWVFLYFGYFEFGLPQRFEFQYLDKTIRSAIPANYSYRISNISGFRGPGTETIAVIAHSKTYDDNVIHLKQSGQDLSDILLLFDKTSRGYHESYKFKPLQGLANGSSSGYSALITGLTSTLYQGSGTYINSQGKTDLILGWFFVGADATPPIPLVFSDVDGVVKAASIDPRIKPFNQNPSRITFIRNTFSPDESTPVSAVDNIFTTKHSIVFTVIHDLVCKACDNNTYQVLYFKEIDGKLVYQHQDPKLIVGYKNVQNHLSTGFLDL